MALFWSKKSKAEKIYDKAAAPAAKKTGAKGVKSAKVVKTKAVAASSAPVIPAGAFGTESEAILRPHITEKSGLLSQFGTYTFQVSRGASKQSVSKAVKALYKVSPVKIAMVNLPARNVVVKGRRGVVPGVRKALVTVKKGDKIDFA